MGSAAPLEGVPATALAVAAIRAEETARPDRLFADPLAAAFVAASGWASSRPTGDRRAIVLRAWVVARTVFLDELLASACAEGRRQVVLLGAGLDARPFRLPWPPGVRWFELDTADVLDHKDLVLAQQAAVAGCERIPVRCDLRADWPGELLAAGFEPGQPTVWVAEGVLAYLAQEEVEGVLADLTTLSAQGSRLGLSMASRDPAQAGPTSRARSLRLSDAPLDPVGWLAGHGWAAQVTHARAVLRGHGRIPGAGPGPAEPATGSPAVPPASSYAVPPAGSPAVPPAGSPAVPPAGSVTGPQASPTADRPARGLLISATRDEASRRARPASPRRADTAPAAARVPAAAGRVPEAADTASAAGHVLDAAGRAPEPDAGPERLPLSALLSQVLVAFTIECDNEFERQMPHSTTSHGRTPGAPWLVSMAMWSNCLRFVGEDPITVGELGRLARTETNLDGMRRWGYIDVRPDPDDRRAKPPRPDLTVRATPAGLRAQQVWQPLPGVVEKRWQERFGGEVLGDLRGSLRAVAARLDGGLPDCLPILGYGLWTSGPERRLPPEDVSGLGLPVLLSRVLLAFATEFERESDVSLAISADLLRVLDQQGVRLRDLPLLAGVSKEAISMAMGIANKRGLAVLEPDPAASRGQVARLTLGGRSAQDVYRRLLAGIEDAWQERFGSADIRGLRQALARLAAAPGGQPSPLWLGLDPYPGGWRASVRRPRTLPHFPMVLHRGGFPDGS
jgi:methyltransferase (TIGR00027 family)